MAKYLMESEETYYSVQNEMLTALEVDALTAESFTVYGTDEVPASELLVMLKNPRILCWTDEDVAVNMTAKVTALPLPQNIIFGTVDLTDESIKGIEKITMTCEGNVVIAISVDEKQTWQAHNGTEWIVLTDEHSGMSKERLEAVAVDQWVEVIGDSRMIYLRVSMNATDQSLTEIYVDFVN